MTESNEALYQIKFYHKDRDQDFFLMGTGTYKPAPSAKSQRQADILTLEQASKYLKSDDPRELKIVKLPDNFLQARLELEQANSLFAEAHNYENKLRKIVKELDEEAEQIGATIGFEEDLPGTLRSAEQELSEYINNRVEPVAQDLKQKQIKAIDYKNSLFELAEEL